mgnify:CR=1 FL=1
MVLSQLCVVLNNAEAALSELREQFFSLSDFSDVSFICKYDDCDIELLAVFF